MRSTILLSTALVIITLLVYLKSADNGFLSFDDSDYITGNPPVASGITGNNIMWAFTTTHSANWHPLTWLSHMTDVQLYGMNPRGHHLTNIIIHALSSTLLFLLFFRLTSALWQSFFVAALFALHPLHVESVAWAAERKDVLSALFLFLTLFAYAGFVKEKKTTCYLLTLLLFALGLMSKPMLVTVPLMMMLMDYWPLKRYQQNGSALTAQQLSGRVTALAREKIPFFLCSLLSAIITIYAQGTGGAITNMQTMPPGFRLENSLIAYATYLGKTVWPHNLAVLYPIPASYPLWQVSGAVVTVLILTALSLRVVRRYPYIPAGWFWYLFTLLPVIGLIQVGNQSMADRYTYIPHIGIFIIIAWGFSDLTERVRYRKAITALLASAVLIVSSLLTWQQIGYWKDDFSLYSHTLQVTEGNYVINTNLGTVYQRAGDLDAAIGEYRTAIEIKPDFFNAHYNLGVALATRGDLDAAIREYKTALEIQANDPDAHASLGSALARKGDIHSAMMEFQEAVRLKPESDKTCNLAGIALASNGELDAAVYYFREALRINPDNKKARSNLGIALGNKRAFAEKQQISGVKP